MPTDKKLKSLVLNVMTEEQYNSAEKNEDELYLTPDEGGGDTVHIVSSNPYHTPSHTVYIKAGTYALHDVGWVDVIYQGDQGDGTDKLFIPQLWFTTPIIKKDDTEFFIWIAGITNRSHNPAVRIMYICTKAGTLTSALQIPEITYYSGVAVK